VLFAAADDAVIEMGLSAVELGSAAGLVCFRGNVVGIRRNAAPYARVTSLIGFALDDEAATLRRWKSQISAMRAFPI